MLFLCGVSNLKGACDILTFGNSSWSGTPFGSSSDTCIPVKKKKQKKADKNQNVFFEFNDQFNII